MVKFQRVQPAGVPNIINGVPRPARHPARVRFSFRVDPDAAAQLPELEDRIRRYRERGARYTTERVVKTLALDPELHQWMKEEAEKCGMTLGRFTGRLLHDPDLAPQPVPLIKVFNDDGSEWQEPDPAKSAAWS